jgi:hypothetical protein
VAQCVAAASGSPRGRRSHRSTPYTGPPPHSSGQYWTYLVQILYLEIQTACCPHLMRFKKKIISRDERVNFAVEHEFFSNHFDEFLQRRHAPFPSKMIFFGVQYCTVCTHMCSLLSISLFTSIRDSVTERAGLDMVNPFHPCMPAVYFRGKFWVFGGSTGDDSYDHTITDKVQAYNPRTQTWSVEKSLTSPRHKVTTWGFQWGCGGFDPCASGL